MKRPGEIYYRWREIKNRVARARARTQKNEKKRVSKLRDAV